MKRYMVREIMRKFPEYYRTHSSDVLEVILSDYVKCILREASVAARLEKSNVIRRRHILLAARLI